MVTPGRRLCMHRQRPCREARDERPSFHSITRRCALGRFTQATATRFGCERAKGRAKGGVRQDSSAPAADARFANYFVKNMKGFYPHYIVIYRYSVAKFPAVEPDV